MVYNCIASATGFLNKVYLGNAKGEFKKWFYNHNTSFKNESKRNDTTLAKYVRLLHFKICGTIFKHYKEVQIMSLREIRNLSYPNPLMFQSTST